LYRSSARPLAITVVDAFAALSVVAIGATIVAYALYPIESAHTIGMFPVLMLATSATFLVLAAIFSRGASPVAIISGLITGVLLLARLTDQCPEFAHHLFGISSVSGGSLGAAVFAELLRALPATAPNDPASPSTSCSPTRGPEFDNALQTKIGEFFSTDFLSP